MSKAGTVLTVSGITIDNQAVKDTFGFRYIADNFCGMAASRNVLSRLPVQQAFLDAVQLHI